MAYSVDLREKVMDYMDSGNSIRQTSKVFGVGTTTIKEWKKLRTETGTLEKRPLDRKSPKLSPDRLVAYINEHPDSFLEEIAEAFGCTPQAVFYALRRNGITRKKNG